MIRFVDFPWLHMVEETNTNVQLILAKMENVMATLDDLEAKVAEVQGVQASAVALLQSLRDELEEALTSGDVAARVQAVIDKLDTSTDELSAAVAANPESPSGP